MRHINPGGVPSRRETVERVTTAEIHDVVKIGLLEVFGERCRRAGFSKIELEVVETGVAVSLGTSHFLI